MKKKIIIILSIIAVIIVAAVVCFFVFRKDIGLQTDKDIINEKPNLEDNTDEKPNIEYINGKYVLISMVQEDNFVYDKETKQCYLMIKKYYGKEVSYAFIPLYDENGEPLLYKEKES